MAFAVWITGLPGSGKSTIAKRLREELNGAGVAAAHLRLDEFRKNLTPSPVFTEEEREAVYERLVAMAAEKVGAGENVIIDATAHRRKWREAAGRGIRNYVEVFVKCDLSVCMERESGRKEGLVTADLYSKALERRRSGKKMEGVGEVVGVDVPYEEGAPDIVVESDKMSAKETAHLILEELKRRGMIKC